MTTTPPPMTADLLSAWLVERVAGMLELPAEDVDTEVPLADLGLSSLQAVEIAGDLEVAISRPVEPMVVYDHPTIDALAIYAARVAGSS